MSHDDEPARASFDPDRRVGPGRRVARRGRVTVAIQAGLAVSLAAACAPFPAMRSHAPMTALAEERDRETARITLDAWERAANARDLDGILALAAPDESLRKSLRARYEGLFGLDSLCIGEELGAIFANGGALEAVVLERATWVEHGREMADATWRTRTYERRASGADGRPHDSLELAGDEERTAFEAEFIDLAVDLHPDAGNLVGRARIDVRQVEPGEDRVLFRLNRGLQISAARDARGDALPVTRIADLVTIPLAAIAASRGPDAASPLATPSGGVPSGDSLTVEIDFAGSFFNESKEQGYSQVGITPAGSFASWVANWYPRIAGAGSKSRGRITWTAPSGTVIASSGHAVGPSAGGAGETAGETAAADRPPAGRMRQVFEVTAPLDFSFGAAPYYHRSRNVDGIDVAVFFLQGGEAKADLYIERCSRILAFLRGLYGFYPFDGYSVVEVPPDAVGTLGGSSEQGMNLFPAGGLPDSLFPLPLLAHEIGHSWWGNRVSGEGPIIDEGLAQMTAALAVEELAGPRVMRRFLRRGLPRYPQSAELYFRRYAGQPGKDLPIERLPAGSDEAMILHDLADTKGFFAYQMLRDEIGSDAFVRGLRKVLADHDMKSVRLADLQRAWETESGRDLRWFFDQWFGRPGAPEFRLRYATAPVPGGGFVTEGEVTQDSEGEPWRVRAEIVLAKDGEPARREPLEITGALTPFRFGTASRPDTVLFDPDYKLLRWTDAYRAIDLLARARSLYAAGMVDSAGTALDDYLARAPGATSGHALRGRWRFDAGDVAGAETEFRTVVNSIRHYDIDDPVVTRSEVGLGKIADLAGRRDDAIAWYRKALERDDDQEAIAEATKGLAQPVTAPQPVAAGVSAAAPAPDPALLDRCAGVYGMDAGFAVTVSRNAAGFLEASAGAERTALEFLGGTRFRAAGGEGATFEFNGAAGSGAFDSLSLNTGGGVLRLGRRQ